MLNKIIVGLCLLVISCSYTYAQSPRCKSLKIEPEIKFEKYKWKFDKTDGFKIILKYNKHDFQNDWPGQLYIQWYDNMPGWTAIQAELQYNDSTQIMIYTLSQAQYETEQQRNVAPIPSANNLHIFLFNRLYKISNTLTLENIQSITIVLWYHQMPNKWVHVGKVEEIMKSDKSWMNCKQEDLYPKIVTSPHYLSKREKQLVEFRVKLDKIEGKWTVDDEETNVKVICGCSYGVNPLNKADWTVQNIGVWKEALNFSQIKKQIEDLAKQYNVQLESITNDMSWYGYGSK